MYCELLEAEVKLPEMPHYHEILCLPLAILRAITLRPPVVALLHSHNKE
jgi:hypothetical protein